MAICTKALEGGDESGVLTNIHASIDGCTKCSLYEGNHLYVPGMGTSNTTIMIIGEGPGKREDELGLPFVGASGKFLDTLLTQIGLSRNEIYITNVVKCRPPENRDPKPEEIAACDDYLEQQISAINPKMIITLGRFSMAKFLPGVKISQVHGMPKRRSSDGRIVFPCYHPAVALYNGGMRSVLEADFLKIPKILSQLT